MGNRIDSGFNVPPPIYLRQIRKETNRHLREIAASKRRDSVTTVMTKKEKKETEGVTELTASTVTAYIISNPSFLDDLVVHHISQDRVRAWLKDRKSSESDNTKATESDPDFAAEMVERSFRHRQLLLITRSRFLFPFRYKRDELNELIERPQLDDYEEEVESHLFPYTEVPPEDINKVFMHMCMKLLGKHAFPMPELCYFLSTLKTNYHNVEYHNYNHALSHAQSLYWVLRKNPGVFTELEMKCLLISGLAHDVGHPGVNDSYIKNVGSGLERLYHTPILENHHTQVTFLILQDINCNIFRNIEGDDYKQVLNEIQHAILSTSLNRYKLQCEHMRHLIATDLDFSKKEVRDATKSVLMMACDLCSSWKAWQEHKNSVWMLYKEFFSQGDRELHFGLDSVPQMLRTNADKIPEYQVLFLQNVILPVFQIAVKVFPNTSGILDSTTENLELWNTYL